MASTKFDGIWKLMNKYTFEMASDSINDDLKCILCKKLMIDACVSTCSCQFCHKCIYNYLFNGDRYCPGGKDKCNEEYLDMDLHVHRNKTLNNNIYGLKVKCSNKLCQSQVVLSEMEEHLKVCLAQQNQCPYVMIGCNDRGSITDSLLTHLQDETLVHSRLLIERIESLQDELRLKDKQIECLQVESKKKDKQMKDLKSEVTSIREESIHMKNTMAKLEKQLEPRMSAMKTGRRVGFSPSVERAQDRVEKLNVPTEKDIFEIKDDFAIGVLTMTVDHFSTKKMSNNVILSPYFYSHHNGYKLRLRIFPGGYADRKTFLSVHFIICKGEYDDLLSWPCQYSINISIVNQCTEEIYNNRTYEFSNVAEIGKEMFNKPSLKDNKPCGHNTFISHKELEDVTGLICDDSVMIRCALCAPT